MATTFILPTKTRIDEFTDTVSEGDVTKYSFDCTPWQDDNETITAASWTCIAGAVSITNTLNTAGVVSANIGTNQAGTALITILLQTASGLTKKIWLYLRVKSRLTSGDDYGLNGN